MEGSRAKVEVFKPVLLKAGIPLAISVAGFILARITTRKRSISESSSFESSHSLDSTSLHHMEDEQISTDTYNYNPAESLQSQKKLEEEIEGLRKRIEDFEEREWELEMGFFRYHNLKEQEVVLMEFQNNLLLEIARVEFLGREISSIEAENQRFEDMVAEYVKVLEQLEFSRLENGLIRRKAKKLLKKTKEVACVVSKQNLQIKAKDVEISRNNEELEKRAGTIKGLEDEIMELQTVLGRLEDDKKELMNKLHLAEESASLKIEEGGLIIDDYNQLVNEVEKVQKDRDDEVKELIYLRWCNACLRHELMRRNQEQKENSGGNNNQLELDVGENREMQKFGLEDDVLGHGQTCLGLTTTTRGHAYSKRRKLIDKFKRWVEKNEKFEGKLGEKEKHQSRTFGSYLVSDGVKEREIPSRVSCSSDCI